MGGYTLNKNDYDIISKLKGINTSMVSLYKNLYELEISGRKDTLDYSELIKLVSDYIKEEDKIYVGLEFSDEKCEAWLKYLNGIEDNGNILFGSISDFDCIKRISNRVSKIRNNLAAEFIYSVFSLNSGDFNEVIDASEGINFAFNNDFADGYLYFLDYFINNDNFSKYRNSLIKTKYELAFLKTDFDKGMCKSNFESPKSLYISSKMISDLYELPNYIFMNLKSIMVSIVFWEYADILLEINDDNYNIDYYNICSIMCQSFMRAALIMDGDDRVEEIEREYSEKLLDSDYRKKHLNHRISESIVMQCLQNAKYDRDNVSYLSLRKEK